MERTDCVLHPYLVSPVTSHFLLQGIGKVLVSQKPNSRQTNALILAGQANVHLQDEGIPLPLISTNPTEPNPVNSVEFRTICNRPFFRPAKNRDEHLDAKVMVSPVSTLRLVGPWPQANNISKG